MSMKTRVAILTAFLSFSFFFVLTQPAWAYIDPATTTYIIQVAAAIVITLGVSLSIFLYRFQMIITNMRVWVHALVRRLRKQNDFAGVAPARVAEKAVDKSITEEEALLTNTLDYALPVFETYPMVVAEAEYTVASAKKEPEEAVKLGRLRRLGRWLWRDKRTLKERAGRAALVAAGLSMTFVVLNILDTIKANQNMLFFSFSEVAGLLLLLGAAAFIAIFLILLPLRGRVFDFFFCLLLSVLVCSYLQNTFFNGSLDRLMGQSLSWAMLGFENVLGNAVFWLAIILCIFVLGFMRKPKVQKFFKRFAVFVPALLVGIQFIAALSLLPPLEEWDTRHTNTTQVVATWKDVNVISTENNVLVFIVDTMDERFVDTLAAEYPETLENLDGFTRFTNCTSRYSATFPSVVNLLTNRPWNPHISPKEWMGEAYQERSFVEDIHDLGFESNLYIDDYFSYSDGRQLEGLADNLTESSVAVDPLHLTGELMRFSLLKCAPLSLKDALWLPPSVFSVDRVGMYTSEDLRPYWAEDPLFYEAITTEQGLEAEAAPHFGFYHLNGFHGPYMMNEYAERTEQQDSPMGQIRGTFYILDEYFSQLKEQGLYKDTTIIITGDHAAHTMSSLLYEPRLIGCFVKPAGSEGTPLQYNDAPVTNANMRATCVAAAGGDGSAWGPTFFEVPRSTEAVRYYTHRYFTNNGFEDQYFAADYRIIGDARDWNNWTLINNEQLAYEHSF